MPAKVTARGPGAPGGGVASHGASHATLRSRTARHWAASLRRIGRRPTGPSWSVTGQPGAMSLPSGLVVPPVAVVRGAGMV
jgi:hypothetical protein